jgi:hypothetical protein
MDSDQDISFAKPEEALLEMMNLSRSCSPCSEPNTPGIRRLTGPWYGPGCHMGGNPLVALPVRPDHDSAILSESNFDLETAIIELQPVGSDLYPRLSLWQVELHGNGLSRVWMNQGDNV